MTVLGEVGVPSSFPLVKATRVVEAIGQVGGTRPFAANGRIRVIRATASSSTTLLVDLSAIQKGDLSSNLLLLPGDIVFVPPTYLARFGYAMQAILYPFSPLLGLANSAGGNLIVP